MTPQEVVQHLEAAGLKAYVTPHRLHRSVLIGGTRCLAGQPVSPQEVAYPIYLNSFGVEVFEDQAHSEVPTGYKVYALPGGTQEVQRTTVVTLQEALTFILKTYGKAPPS